MANGWFIKIKKIFILYLDKDVFYCNKRASSTIELALLMPGIIASILLIIFSCFYAHDICYIEKISFVTVQKIASDVSQENIILQEMFDRNIENGVIGAWDISREVIIDENIIQLSVEGKMNNDGDFFLGYLNGKLFYYKTVVYANNINIPSYIRRMSDDH